MSRAKSGIVANLIVIVCLVPVLLSANDKWTTPAGRDRCPVCGMFVSPYADWNAVIEFRDAERLVFDGPKDMFRYLLNMKKYNPSKSVSDVLEVTVKDYYTKKAADARKSYFVIWSDVYGPMGHEPIPFEKEADAKEFLREHKGKAILKFSGITRKLILSLDNPE